MERTREQSSIFNLQSSIFNLQFSISDTGPGIAPDEIDRLFEAFEQTKTGREAQEGTGLGLPISRKFVQLMGGDMTVRSEVGRDTVFRFDIRVELIETTDFITERPTRRVIGLAPGQPRYRILIVDDKPTNRQLFMKLLMPFAPSTDSEQGPATPPSTSLRTGLRTGFELREAANGQEAVEIWDSWEPHLIWMDLRMPVMDGYEATKRIKSEIRNSKSEIQTVIIAVTASSFEEEQAIVLAAGCDDFLRKPFREAQIFELIHKHIEVCYVYEESQKSKVPSTSLRTGFSRKLEEEDVLTPEALAALPDELVAGLQQAVEAIDLKTTNSMIARIREHNEPMANALAELVKQFRFDKLQQLFEE